MGWWFFAEKVFLTYTSLPVLNGLPGGRGFCSGVEGAGRCRAWPDAAKSRQSGACFVRRLLPWSRLRRGRLILAPHARQSGLDLLLHAGDQLAVGVDQRLLGLDLRHDRALGFEGREGN